MADEVGTHYREVLFRQLILLGMLGLGTGNLDGRQHRTRVSGILPCNNTIPLCGRLYLRPATVLRLRLLFISKGYKSHRKDPPWIQEPLLKYLLRR